MCAVLHDGDEPEQITVVQQTYEVTGGNTSIRPRPFTDEVFLMRKDENYVSESIYQS